MVGEGRRYCLAVRPACLRVAHPSPPRSVPGGLAWLNMGLAGARPWQMAWCVARCCCGERCVLGDGGEGRFVSYFR